MMFAVSHYFKSMARTSPKFKLQDPLPRYKVTRQTKGRIKKVLDVVASFNLPADVSYITQHKGSTNSAEYEGKLTTACAALVQIISVRLNGMGGSKDNKPLTLASADAKITRLKNPSKKLVATPTNDASYV